MAVTVVVWWCENAYVNCYGSRSSIYLLYLLIIVQSHQTDSPGNVMFATEVSIHTGSFFAHCGLTGEKIVMLKYHWEYELKCTRTVLLGERQLGYDG